VEKGEIQGFRGFPAGNFAEKNGNLPAFCSAIGLFINAEGPFI